MDNVEDHLEYEKALTFLVENLRKSGNNPKPVGIHSVLVATRLYRHSYKKSVVVAALLHDVIEDTAVTIEEVKEKFGEPVARLIKAMTRNTRHLSFDEKYKSFTKHMEELLEAGTDALAIAASDFIENSYFYKRGDSKELLEYLIWKYEKFMKDSKTLLSDSPLQSELEYAYKDNIVKSLN
ncbi:hypothetical protein A3J32_01605 [Candidatus Saccharibacteria bacterium RIFCSPLOWO2_02_FULL_46_7]|nr:MAG: hypothetical protein A3J32_01605 [Candidatus Saccharibacteria bacterium RIFCSPLOWO2_02_FULL_46_7]